MDIGFYWLDEGGVPRLLGKVSSDPGVIAKLCQHSTFMGQWNELMKSPNYDTFLQQHENPTVAWDKVDGVEISTVFLFIDHGMRITKPFEPILWETMVWNAAGEIMLRDRCGGNQDQAMAMHVKAVTWVKQQKGDSDDSYATRGVDADGQASTGDE